MRERVKEHFPTVLLTLVSIVQALALELWWSSLVQVDDWSGWTGLLTALQTFATFLGIVLVWVIYSSNVMRFRWVPGTMDSVFPFLIGLIEFMLVETLGPERLGFWFVLMAVIFGSMNWIAHLTMRRARQDPDNRAYFEGVGPARLRDFRLQIFGISALGIVGVFFILSAQRGVLALVVLLALIALLSYQFQQVALFWKRSLADDP
jgi:hypothetical protein